MPNIQLTNTIIVDALNPCENPVYLRWKNQLGGWCYWLFVWNQSKELDTDSGEQYRIDTSNLSSANTVIKDVQKEGREVWVLTADDLYESEIKLIRLIALSPTVERYVNDSSPVYWEGVRVDQSSIGSYESKNKRHTITFQIILPEQFTIAN